MDESEKVKNQAGEAGKQNCDCDGNCCPQKKNSKSKIFIVTLILLAAIGVIAFKIVNKPAPTAGKESCCPPQSSTGYDTTKTATCDTTKGSSCCPK
jgi:hypothetical protein